MIAVSLKAILSLCGPISPVGYLKQCHFLSLKYKHRPKWMSPSIKHSLNCLSILRKNYKLKASETTALKIADLEQSVEVLIDNTKSSYESSWSMTMQVRLTQPSSIT